MYWILYIVAALVGLFVLVFVWGLVHLYLSRKRAFAQIETIDLAEIEALAQECVDVFRARLNIELDLDLWEDAAQKLDDVFRNEYQLKEIFAREDFYWYFVKPMGHSKFEWRKSAGFAPHMELLLHDGNSEITPFQKILKQVMVGDPGDIVAYVATARSMEKIAAQQEAEK